jgi:thioredoxin-related protein
MSKITCLAVKNKIVPKRGTPTIEFYDKNGKPQYYCRGYMYSDTECAIDECKKCADFVNNLIFNEEIK